MPGLDELQDRDLLESVIGVRPGDHICVLYDYTSAERLSEVASFLKEGLDCGEQCVYVVDDLSLGTLHKWFEACGIEVQTEQERKSLLLWTKDKWRQPGVLDSIKKAAQVREIIDSALIAGFKGVRFAVEMTWTLDPDLSSEAIEHWESTSNQLLVPGAPVRVMCLYGKRRLHQATIDAGLRTHALVLDADGLRVNALFGAAPAEGASGR